MARGYTTKADVEAYMQTDIDASFNDQLDIWIASVEDEVDRLADRQLLADDAETTLKYDGSGQDSLMIDDFATITEVLIGETSYLTDIFFYPTNKPYTWKLTRVVPFPKDMQNISVTGLKGAYVTLPTNITVAVSILVAGVVNSSTNFTDGEVRSESIGRYSVTFISEDKRRDFVGAMATIKSYRRLR